MKRWLALFIAPLIFVMPEAQAYVPPSHYMVKMFTNKKAATKAVRVRSLLTTLPGNDVKVHTFTVYDPRAKHLRVWITDEADQVLYRVERRGDAVPLAVHLLFEPELAALAQQLVKNGIPVKAEEELLLLPDEDQRRAAEILALRRWRGNPAWVIGRPEKPDPQLWVEKDSFLPIRLLAQYDIQMESYSFFRGYPYPKTITVLSLEGKPLLKEDLQEFLGGNTFPELRTAEFPHGFTDAGNAVSGAIRDLIESYFKVLR